MKLSSLPENNTPLKITIHPEDSRCVFEVFYLLSVVIRSFSVGFSVCVSLPLSFANITLDKWEKTIIGK